ncbi:hypothetical protein FF011L_20950 [Roseimaritima multifibrata]|uniref:Uncharacterized protein n=1 Tax=Roseimaritima multifibrata TaxID=1930274 RepID=A0A517MEL5_9BACT|nr:hypothetical protein [Roseimaritima multifibrata]QDS93332.1 hypothetical protein FF011L_20950 [Roseimaritima multifibrata]
MRIKAQRATDKRGSVARWAFLFAIPTPAADAQCHLLWHLRAVFLADRRKPTGKFIVFSIRLPDGSRRSAKKVDDIGLTPPASIRRPPGYVFTRPHVDLSTTATPSFIDFTSRAKRKFQTGCDAGRNGSQRPNSRTELNAILRFAIFAKPSQRNYLTTILQRSD